MAVVYLDACCLNRPFDDQTQDRIRLEAEAVALILTHIGEGEWEWVGSEVLRFELSQIPDLERRYRVQLLAKHVHRSIEVEPAAVRRAVELEALGFQAVDALHIACAEKGGADVFLTTDDRLLRTGARLAKELRLHLANPLVWLREKREG